MTGMAVPDGHESHEVDMPKELYEAARPDLSEYVLHTKKGSPALVKRGGK